MNKLTILIFFFSITSYAQTVDQLEERKERLQKEIVILQDSLKEVEKKIEALKKKKKTKVEKEEHREEDLSVLPNVVHLYVLRDTPLLSFPGKIGDTISVIKKGKKVQIVDKKKGYFLSCISGNCGYILQKDLEKKKLRAR